MQYIEEDRANLVDHLSHDPESRYFDRKSAHKDPAEISRHVMALANAAGGRLAIGIEDDGEVTGFERDKAHPIDSFEDVPITLLVPPPRVEFVHVPVTNSNGQPDTVLLMDVAPSENAVVRRRTDGKVSLREGDQSVWLDVDQIRALERDKGQASFEDEVCPGTSMSDVDVKAVSLYKTALGTSISDEQLLRSRRFLRDGRLTNAGVLLFASEPSFILPQARVRVIKVDGTELRSGARMNVVKDKTFDGPLVRSLPVARDFVRSQLRDFQFQQSGGDFVTVPEYPEFPWTEGLANAMAHRDYSLRGEYIRVYIYDDRMEIRSPGGLPNIVTVDNMRSTRWSRNPAIARVFAAFEWVRELNEGVNKIYADMEAAGLPKPVYSEPDRQTVLLTLYNDVAHRIPRLRGEVGLSKESNALAHSKGTGISLETYASLTDDEKRIVRAISRDGQIGAKATAELLGISRQSASRKLRRLAEVGVLKWVGQSKRDPRQHYVLEDGA
jgi:ATP-dependent DNA helicase RecG